MKLVDPKYEDASRLLQNCGRDIWEVATGLMWSRNRKQMENGKYPIQSSLLESRRSISGISSWTLYSILIQQCRGKPSGRTLTGVDTWIVHFGRNEAFDPELLLQPATKVPVAAPCAGKTCYEAARTHTPCTRRERTTHARAENTRTKNFKRTMYCTRTTHMQAGKTLAESVGSNLNVNASKRHTIMQIITAVFLCTMCMVHVLVYEMCFCLSFCTECVERQASDLEVTGCPISGLPWASHLPRFCRGIQDSRNHLLAWIWFVFCDKEAENRK